MRPIDALRARLISVAAATLVLALPGLAAAQPYPAKPIRLIIPFPPGGNTDILGRLMAQKLSESLGQPFIVDNRGGGGGVIGADAAAKSPPDGYTLFFGTTGSLASQPALRADIPYDPIKSFAPISPLAAAPNVLMVNASMPVSTLKEFIDYAKARPGKLTFGSAGIGHMLHVAGEGLNRAAGIELFHVPYKGAPQSLADLLAGRLDVMFDTIVIYADLVRAGKLKALAVANPTRLRGMPQIPTMAEAGLPGFEFASYFGLLVPAGTPPEIIRKLNAETLKALGSGDVLDTLAKMGLEPSPMTPEQYSTLIAADLARWKKLVAEIGIKLE